MNDLKRNWPLILAQILFVMIFAGLGYYLAYERADLVAQYVTISNVIYTILIVVISFPLHILIHEVGHVLGGMFSGYELIMFRLFNHMWIKTEKGVSYRKQYVPGLLGQALMVPPKDNKKEKTPFLLYHMGGILLNGITAVLFIFAANDLYDELLSYFLYISAGIALFILFTNLIPNRGTDGYNILQHFKREEADREVLDSLLMFRDMTLGATFQYLQKYVHLDAIESLENPMTTTMYSVYAANFLEMNEFEQARGVYEYLWKNFDDIIEMHKANVVFNYLFTLLLTDAGHPDVEKLLRSPYIKQYDKVKQADVFRVFTAVALYYEQDLDKAEGLLDEGEKLVRYAPTISEENLEANLYQYLRKEIVLRKHEKALS